MAESINGLIANARKAKYSLIAHLSEEDVLNIWDHLSDFIEKQMLLMKGVSILGFGTFSFSPHQKIESNGKKKVKSAQRPVLSLSDTFVQSHSLQYAKQQVAGKVPVIPLNYTMISSGTHYDRETVEICVREVLQALSRTLALGRDVEMDFNKVGRFVVAEKKAKMKFFKEFLHALVLCGSISNSFRPASRDSSIMTCPYTPRSVTAASLVLPKIVEASDDSEASLRLSVASANLKPSSLHVSQKDSTKHDRKKPKSREHARSTSEPVPLKPEAISLLRKDLHTASTSLSSLNMSTKSSRPQMSASSKNVCSECARPPSTDLCYICHQRALREKEREKIPLKLARQRMEAERLQDKLLQDYLKRKDAVEITKEQVKRARMRSLEKDAADFNLEASKHTKVKTKQQSVGNSEFHPSYVFKNRPLTPPECYRQDNYCKELDEQVTFKQQWVQGHKKLEADAEKREQKRLTEELAAMEAEYRRKNLEKKRDYLHALDDQVCQKSSQYRSPSPVPQPIFVVQEDSADKLKERQERARAIRQEHLSTIEQRQQMAKEKRAKDIQEDSQTLQSNKKVLLQDIQQSRTDRLKIQKALQQAWKESMQEREQLLLQELQRAREPSKLLHDECQKYLRCRQCQRKRDNVGKSNILAESRYISGSRLMV